MTMENDLVERLLNPSERHNEWLDMLYEAAVRIQALEAELARKTEALRPFVVYVPDVCFVGKEKWTLVPATDAGGGWIGSEDFRAARSALEEKTDV